MIFPFVYDPYASPRYEATTSLPLYYPSPPFSPVLFRNSWKDFFVKHTSDFLFSFHLMDSVAHFTDAVSYLWEYWLFPLTLFSLHIFKTITLSLLSHFYHFTSWKLWYLLLHMYNSNVNGNSKLKYTWSVIHKVFKTPLSFLNSIKLPKLWLSQNYYNLLQVPKCSKISG